MEIKNTMWPSLPTALLIVALAVLTRLRLSRVWQPMWRFIMPKSKDPFEWVTKGGVPPRSAEVDVQRAREPLVATLTQEAVLTLFAWVESWNTGEKKPRYVLLPFACDGEQGIRVLRLTNKDPVLVISATKYSNGRWCVCCCRENFASSNRFCDEAELVTTIEEMLNDRDMSMVR